MPLISKSAIALELVARFGSVRKASEHINISASALNKQILNLEAEYGTPLFERLPRGMRPTEAGLVLLNQVRRWQEDSQGVDLAIGALKGRAAGRVNIGFMECLAGDFAADAFVRLQSEYADVTLHTIVGGTKELISLLNSGEIDVAVAFNAPHDLQLKVIHESKFKLGVVLQNDHPLIEYSELGPRDLLNHTLVLGDDALTIGPISMGMLKRLKANIATSAESNSVQFLKSLVKRGAGISLLTRLDIYDELKTRELAFRPLSSPRKYTTLSVCLRDDKALSPAALRLSEIICDLIDDLIESSEHH